MKNSNKDKDTVSITGNLTATPKISGIPQKMEETLKLHPFPLQTTIRMDKSNILIAMPMTIK